MDRSKNPYITIFNDTSRIRYNSPSEFDNILKENKPKVTLEKSNDELSPATDLYEVDTNLLTIKCIHNKCRNRDERKNKRQYSNSKYATFIYWLAKNAMYGRPKNDSIYTISMSIPENAALYEGILACFNDLPPAMDFHSMIYRAGATGSLRRRRPSRKYKKSKRVLRKKSCSTRRR